MQAIQVGSVQGFTWVHQALRAYGRHLWLWILIGIAFMLITVFGVYTSTLSVITLFFEPLLMGLFFYIAHRVLTQQGIPLRDSGRLIKRAFFPWIGLGILLAISTFLAYCVLFLLFILVASSVGIISMTNISTMIMQPVSQWFPSPSEHALFLSITAVIIILISVLIQTIILYAPGLLIARALDYRDDMTIGHSLFSSCVGTMINWRPLFVNACYLFVYLCVALIIATIIGLFIGRASIVTVYPLILYCVVLPIVLLNLYYSFRSIFVDTKMPETNMTDVSAQ